MHARTAAASRRAGAGSPRSSSNGETSSRTLGSRLSDGPNATSGDDGPILDATLDGIGDATKTVVEIITRVRTVNNSLLGSAPEPEGIGRDEPLPEGRAYRANVGLAQLRNALVVLADEVNRLERL